MGPLETSFVNHYDTIRHRLNGGPPSNVIPIKTEKPPATDALQAQIDSLNTRLTAAESLLASILSPQSTALEKTITVEDIIRLVCKHEGIRRNVLAGTRRHTDIVLARHIVCYLSANHTPRSFGQIGKKLGNKDHTTIYHGLEKLTEQRKTDLELDARLTFYEKLLWAL